MRKTDIVKREGKGRMKAIVKEMVAAGLCMCMLATMAGCNGGFPGVGSDTDTGATTTETTSDAPNESSEDETTSSENSSGNATDTKEGESREGTASESTAASSAGENIRESYIEQANVNVTEYSGDISGDIYCYYDDDLSKDDIVEKKGDDYLSGNIKDVVNQEDEATNYYVLVDTTKYYYGYGDNGAGSEASYTFTFNKTICETVAKLVTQVKVDSNENELKVYKCANGEYDNILSKGDLSENEDNNKTIIIDKISDSNMWKDDEQHDEYLSSESINEWFGELKSDCNSGRRNVVVIITASRGVDGEISSELDNTAGVYVLTEYRQGEGTGTGYNYETQESKQNWTVRYAGDILSDEVSSYKNADGDIIDELSTDNIIEQITGKNIYKIQIEGEADSSCLDDYNAAKLRLDIEGEGDECTITIGAQGKTTTTVSAAYINDENKVKVVFRNNQHLYTDSNKTELNRFSFKIMNSDSQDDVGEIKSFDWDEGNPDSAIGYLTLSSELPDGNYELQILKDTLYNGDGAEVSLANDTIPFEVKTDTVTVVAHCEEDSTLSVEFSLAVYGNVQGDDITKSNISVLNETDNTNIDIEVERGKKQTEWNLKAKNEKFYSDTKYTIQFNKIYVGDSDKHEESIDDYKGVSGIAERIEDTPPTTLILIIAIAVLVVLIIVLIIVLVVHSKRKKEDERRLEEEKQQRSREARGKVMSGGGRLAGESYMQSSGMQAQSPNGKKCVLVVSAPGQPTMEMPISIDGSVVVGRDGGMSGVAISNETISKQQFALEYDGESFYIQDLEARNRTALNGIPLAHKRRVKNGDTITAGAVQIVIRW